MNRDVLPPNLICRGFVGVSKILTAITLALIPKIQYRLRSKKQAAKLNSSKY